MECSLRLSFRLISFISYSVLQMLLWDVIQSDWNIGTTCIFLISDATTLIWHHSSSAALLLLYNLLLTLLPIRLLLDIRGLRSSIVGRLPLNIIVQLLLIT